MISISEMKRKEKAWLDHTKESQAAPKFAQFMAFFGPSGEIPEQILNLTNLWLFWAERGIPEWVYSGFTPCSKQGVLLVQAEGGSTQM